VDKTAEVGRLSEELSGSEFSATGDLKGLVARCLRGEQAALAELVGRYRQRVVGFCRSLLGQQHDAEDVAQETFLRVCRHLHHWDQQREFEPWLLAIAGNRCRTALAARRRRPTPQPLPEVPVEGQHQERAADQLREEVRIALGTLRNEYREAFLLFHERHLSYQEIADRLQVPLGTIKTWVHRARRDLFENLRDRGIVSINEAGHAVRSV